MDAGDVFAQTVPVDENKLQNEKKNRKLNLFFDIVGEFQSIIDPPRKEARGHCKGRGDRPQDKEIETQVVESRVFEKEIDQHKERRAH
jgi:hypothetical protein